MVAIAVSDYDPPYEALPGTLTSARRMVNWAKAPGPGRNYRVLEITDEPMNGEPGRPVTVERLRTEITDLLDNNLIDRLVIYFAGHGVVRSTAEEFWLLTHAGQDDGECVGVMQLIQGLRNYGIGAHNQELLRGQLVIFADACRNVHRDGLNLVPNAVMTRRGNAPNLQVDLFRATTIGAYAFQVRAVKGSKPYCLFSSVLCDALEGKVPEVIERNHHPFKPVISNHALADYLDKEVPRRAIALKEAMEPDIYATIRPNHNYYDILASSVTHPLQQQQNEIAVTLPDAIADEVLKQLGIEGTVSELPPGSHSPLTADTVRNAFEEALQATYLNAAIPIPPIELPGGHILPEMAGSGPINLPEDIDWNEVLAQTLKDVRLRNDLARSPSRDPDTEEEVTSEAPVARIDGRVARKRFEPEPDSATGFRRSLARADALADKFARRHRRYASPHVLFDGSGPIAVPKLEAASLSRVGNGWAYLPKRLCERAIFVRQEHGWTLAPVLQSSQSVLLEELPGEVLLHRVDLTGRWDTSLSSGAQLTSPTGQDSRASEIGDRIRMEKRASPNKGILAGYLYKLANDENNIVRTAHYMAEYGLPFDLAALAASSLTWIRHKKVWHVLADLPAVPAEPNETRPHYAGSKFLAAKSVPVWGLFPVHRQGWLLLAEADRLEIPPVLIKAAEALVSARAVVLPSKALEKISDHFGYVIASP